MFCVLLSFLSPEVLQNPTVLLSFRKARPFLIKLTAV